MKINSGWMHRAQEIYLEIMGVMEQHTNFLEYFSETEQAAIKRIFSELKLPLPETGSFLGGTEGAILFHTDAGIVLRAEAKTSRIPSIKTYEILARELNLDFGIIKAHLTSVLPERLVHDHILQPIASIETDNHIIELVPGVTLGVQDQDIDKLTYNLSKAGINYWDGGRPTTPNALIKILPENIGGFVQEMLSAFNQGKNNSAYLPIKTSEFPNGFPVVADRLAAGHVPLWHDPNSFIRKIIGSKKPSTPVQDKLYGPLKNAFHDAWPDFSQPANSEKMESFWEMCKQHTKTHTPNEPPILNAGWAKGHGMEGKTTWAANAAARYQDQINNNRGL